MIDDLDERLGGWLRADAPPERDPLFRVALIERRERQRFRRRSRALLSAAAASAVLPAVAFTVAPDPFAAGLIAALCMALIAAALLSARGVVRVMRLLRGGTASHG